MDNLSQVAATRLADRIKQFWIARNYQGIKTHIEAARVRDRWGHKLVGREDSIWIIKSNIGPLGYPPKERAC